LAAGRRPPAGPVLPPGAPWLTSCPTKKKGPAVIDWIDQEGIKYLVGAVLAAVGLLGSRLLAQLDHLANTVDQLRGDMIRVKDRLCIDSGAAKHREAD
jgi:hypothetical protein